MDQNREQLTKLMNQLSAGDRSVENELSALINCELKKIASTRLGDRARIAFRPTEVVNAAYERIFGQHVNWKSREHFFKIAARLLSRTIVDLLRYTDARKRDRKLEVPVDAAPGAAASIACSKPNPEETLLDEEDAEDARLKLKALDQALDALKAEKPIHYNIFTEREFNDRTLRDIAEELGLSDDSAWRKWNVAKIFVTAETRRAYERIS